MKSDPERRRLWQNAVKRENWEANTNSRLCNRHFITGKPSKDPSAPNYVPTIFDHVNGEIGCGSTTRYERVKKRKIADISQSNSVSADEVPIQVLDNSTLTERCDVSTMTDLSSEDITKLDNLIKAYKSQVSVLQESAERNTVAGLTLNNFKIFNFYTKFPTFSIFYALLNLIITNWTPNTKTSLSYAEQFLLTLFKLRLGLLNEDLAHRFLIPRATVGCIFRVWIQRMAQVFAPFVSKPSLETLRSHMPRCFIEANLSQVTSIIDCSEIFIERPFNLDARAQTYSNYKSHNTVKFLISITPSGCIEFLSKLYGGRVSDKEITNLSGFLDTLSENDVVLADRGFGISQAVSLKKASVILPASTRNKSQLSAKEVMNSRKISRVRVHVERCIRRIKAYRILKTIWPLYYFTPCDVGSTTCTGDNILTVVAALCNVTKQELLKK